MIILILLQIYKGHTDIIRCIAVDPTGQWLVSGLYGLLSMWYTISGTLMTVFVRLLHLYFVWSIIYVIYYLGHIDEGICKITSPIIYVIYYLRHIDDCICKITSPVLIYYLRHIDDGICKITSPVLIYYLRHIDDSICKITSPVLIYYLRHNDDGICKITSPVFCMVYYLCDILSQAHWWRYL